MKAVRILIAICLCVGVGLAAWALLRPDAGPSQAAAAAPNPPPPVTVSSPLKREVVEWDEYTGQYAAIEHVELRARVSGYLQTINFEEGQMVKRGDLLFVIDPRPFEAALAQTRAQLAEAQARVELANRQLARAGQLRERDFVAASTYDERVQEQRVAAAAAEAVKAEVRAAELNLEFTRITAPVAGRIGRREVSVGNLVTGGANGNTTLLTTIVSQSPIYFTFDMSEAQHLAYERAIADGRLRSTRDGIEVRAQLADETDWPRTGVLDFMDNQIDRSSGTIRVRARFPNDGEARHPETGKPLLPATPGQFGRIRVPGSERYEALLIPDSAIVTDQARKIVMTVSEDGTVAPKPIRPGPMYDGLRIVRSGLTAEDRIVINGLMRARPGAKVTAQPGEIKGAGEARPG
jgi:RND family efflux transporter MFP subunit